ncbi:hypothetical protein CsSME_00014679 [Camellia sinensis var. sinensis]
MDREQEEMQFLGLFGIYRESYKIIISWRKIFSQITLALILPLTFIFLAQIEVSNFLISKIVRTEIQLDETPIGTKKYNKLSDLISSEWTTFLLFKFIYFTFLLVFSLLSTAAVVYTIACVYTARDITFKKIMSVVPKVWKRLMITFLCAFLAFFAYHVLAFLTIVLWFFTVGFTKLGWFVFFVLWIIYVIGSLYLTIVWQLASVVSVLEDYKGLRAMLKSKDLIKGKILVLIQILFQKVVVYGELGGFSRVVFGILCFLLLFKLFLFGLVIQTVIYFVCKSYHHENIDKSSLSDHLEVYLGDYVPLKTKDVQLEQLDV